MSDPAAQTRLSIMAFLDQIEPMQGRYELHDGVIVQLEPSTCAHATLVGNCLMALHPLAHRAGCVAFGSDYHVLREVTDGLMAVVPDCWVLCGQRPAMSAKGADNPTIVVEVMSPATIAFDRGQKMLAYQSIPSLHHVILLYQDRMAAELWTQPDVAGDYWS
jgi:Uma2 family endonuclease